MDAKKLKEILEKHAAWLNDEETGERADLRKANLIGASLSGASLSGADLREADLSRADLSWAKLSRAYLSMANLSGANLSGADLSGADLRWADLRWADLRWADLSVAKGLLQAANFMEAHFERADAGYIAYKTFGSQDAPPKGWKITAGSTIEENANFDRCSDCGSGINVAPLEWVKEHYKGAIWKVLIRWEWLCGVCVPYMSDGKIRCEKVELLGIVEDEKKK